MIPYLKEILGTITLILTFIAFIPYIYSIMRGKTKPHVFSWIVWGIATMIVFFAQWVDNGGAGSWSTGASGVITLYVALLAYFKKSDIVITRMDWVCFLLSLSAIPCWYVTSDPLWAVILLTTIDTLAFFPTIRKALVHPFEEQLFMYIMVAVRSFVSIFALEHYSLTTLLFPATMVVTCTMFVVMVMWRRQQEEQLR